MDSRRRRRKTRLWVCLVDPGLREDNPDKLYLLKCRTGAFGRPFSFNEIYRFPSRQLSFLITDELRNQHLVQDLKLHDHSHIFLALLKSRCTGIFTSPNTRDCRGDEKTFYFFCYVVIYPSPPPPLPPTRQPHHRHIGPWCGDGRRCRCRCGFFRDCGGMRYWGQGQRASQLDS